MNRQNALFFKLFLTSRKIKTALSENKNDGAASLSWQNRTDPQQRLFEYKTEQIRVVGNPRPTNPALEQRITIEDYPKNI